MRIRRGRVSHSKFALLQEIERQQGMTIQQVLASFPRLVLQDALRKNYIVFRDGLYFLAPGVTTKRENKVEQLLPRGDCRCPKHTGEHKHTSGKIAVFINATCPTHSFILTGRKFRNNFKYHFVRVVYRPEHPLITQLYHLHRAQGGTKSLAHTLKGKPSFQYVSDLFEEFGYELVARKKCTTPS